MARRSRAQEIGEQGAAWLLSDIAAHRDWLARELGKDYGIDAEAELAVGGEVRAEILKIQIKTSERVKRQGGCARVMLDRKYLEIAEVTRYPVIFVQVDLEAHEAWYLWLQDWLLKHRSEVRFSSWTHWIPDTDTVASGLDGELQRIAKWQGDTQLLLSLLDALRAASFTRNETAKRRSKTFEANRELLAGARLAGVIDEMVLIGDGIRGTFDGYRLTRVLFDLIRRYGDELSSELIQEMVVRRVADGDGETHTYSRSGLDALSILYDTFPTHISSMGLPQALQPVEPRVAYFCAWRETFPTDSRGFGHPEDFEFAGLRFEPSNRIRDNEANRGNPRSWTTSSEPIKATVGWLGVTIPAARPYVCHTPEMVTLASRPSR
jgi:hypothetical protein